MNATPNPVNPARHAKYPLTVQCGNAEQRQMVVDLILKYYPFGVAVKVDGRPLKREIVEGEQPDILP